jgi:hypothetical protein
VRPKAIRSKDDNVCSALGTKETLAFFRDTEVHIHIHIHIHIDIDIDIDIDVDVDVDVTNIMMPPFYGKALAEGLSN